MFVLMSSFYDTIIVSFYVNLAWLELYKNFPRSFYYYKYHVIKLIEII